MWFDEQIKGEQCFTGHAKKNIQEKVYTWLAHVTELLYFRFWNAMYVL